MKKLHLKRGVCACVIAFTFVSASPNTAEAFVNNAGKYSSQDVRSMEIGANQVKHNGRDSLVRIPLKPATYST
jgi:hypothetical protein